MATVVWELDDADLNLVLQELKNRARSKREYAAKVDRPDKAAALIAKAERLERIAGEGIGALRRVRGGFREDRAAG